MYVPAAEERTARAKNDITLPKKVGSIPILACAEYIFLLLIGPSL